MLLEHVLQQERVEQLLLGVLWKRSKHRPIIGPNLCAGCIVPPAKHEGATPQLSYTKLWGKLPTGSESSDCQWMHVPGRLSQACPQALAGWSAVLLLHSTPPTAVSGVELLQATQLHLTCQSLCQTAGSCGETSSAWPSSRASGLQTTTLWCC